MLAPGKSSNHPPWIVHHFQPFSHSDVYHSSPPSLLLAGVTLEVPICFAPREVKDYAFAVPFVVNGTGKVLTTEDTTLNLTKLILINAYPR